MVQIQSMTFGYGKGPLFEGLDLKLEPGTVFGLLGLNGAGKTSLLKLLAGALHPQSGSIRVFGAEPWRREASFLADTAFVPEDPWLPAVKPSVWLERYAVFRPAFDKEQFVELSREFALDEGKLLTKYSYGQRKKFALAAALASGARLVLLDEPTNGLDIPSKSQFRRALAAAVDADRVIVVSTHQVRDLERVIDPAVIVHGGKILFSLASDQISEKLGSVQVRDLGPDVIYAEKDGVGYSALVARSGLYGGRDDARTADLELLFNAAIASPSRLAAALRGESLSPFEPSEAASRERVVEEAAK
ncbi:MAG: ABC transporter ATP-binding protein [Spirochaetales bacterium]